MKARHSLGLIVAAALMTTGCAKKPPAGLPAPEGSDGSGSGVGTGADADGGPIIPGSQRDFVSRVSADRIYFDTDKFDIDGTDRAILESQAAWLRQYPNVRVTIEGHADERGTRDYNIALGERRANAAKNYLAALGINPARISTVSYGKERPEALGSDEASWARNRRAVTVTVR